MVRNDRTERTKMDGVLLGSNKRQLLCVVFADMAGYSALTSKDELGTHRMWMRFVADVVVPVAEDHDGTIVRTLGDGVLMTFSSASEAYEWAVAVQHRIFEGRVGKTEGYPGLSLRVAAHICEVIHHDGDVYGDGVNITKRLQESIAPDGIIISEDVYHAVRKTTEIQARNLGFLTLKNIGEPIRAFEVIRSEGSGRVGVMQSRVELPSIAVLPLENQSGDTEFNYFADGVVDDIITSLSSLKELMVIARNSTLAFAGQRVDPREVGRILNVRYVLSGTLRRSASRIRITVSLSDTSSGEIVYSDKSDFNHSSLFETQDNIVEHVVARIAPNVRMSEKVKALRKPPDNFTAYDLTLKALDLMSVLDKSSYGQAMVLLEQAMALDPEFAMPVAYAARLNTIYLGQGWAQDRDHTIKMARDFANKAITIDRQNALALAAFGHVKSYLERDYETALLFLDRAREMGPSLAVAWMLSSAALSYVGRPKEAIEHAQHGLRLSPNDPDLFQYYDFLAIAHYLNRDFDEAYKWSERSYTERNDYTSNWRVLAMTASASGNSARAAELVTKITEDMPDLTIDKYLSEICPFRQQKDKDMVSAHLAAAGLH